MKTSDRSVPSAPASGLLSFLKTIPDDSSAAKLTNVGKTRGTSKVKGVRRASVRMPATSKAGAGSKREQPRKQGQANSNQGTRRAADLSAGDSGSRASVLKSRAKELMQGRVAGLVAVIILALLGLAGSVLLSPGVSSKPRTMHAVIPMGASADIALSAVGRSEPVSEERTLAFSVGGLIEEVLVREGDVVRTGQVLVRLEHASQDATVSQAKAVCQEVLAARRKVKAGPQKQEIAHAKLQAERAKIAYQILKKGTREEDLRAMEAKLLRAQTLADSANREVKRLRPAYQDQALAGEVLIKAEDRWNAARAVVEEAQANFDRAKKGARTEEVKRAELAWQAGVLEYQRLLSLPRAEDLQLVEAQVASATSVLKAAQAELDKVSLRAPFSGTVLKILHRKGERVEIFSPSPVLLLGDLDKICLRVEVDEADVGRLFKGQQIRATAKGLGENTFKGHVTRIGNLMGRKRLFTDLPDERVDTRVLEVWVQLHGTPSLPIGYRFKVQFLRNEK